MEKTTRTAWHLGVLLAVTLLAACGGGSGGDDGTAPGIDFTRMLYPPTPLDDPFFDQPDPMPKLAPGTIIASREVRYAPLGIPMPNSAWQLQYMSTGLQGQPMAAIATVVKPLLPALTLNRPLVSFQFAINSAGLKCAPSQQVTGSYANTNSQLEALNYIPQVLALGWTLVFPDHLGPTSSVAVGRVAGPIVLDGIRAAKRFEALGLTADSPVGLMGYSGGGVATAWAAGMQPKYAPELDLRAVAIGGIPANLEATARAFDGSALFFPVMYGAVLSINRLFPQLVPPSLLTEEGKAMAESVKDGCLGGTTDGSAGPKGQMSDYTTVEDIYATPGARDVLPKISLPQPDVAPTADVYFYHQAADQLAPFAEMQKVADDWCARGSPVHVFKDFTGEHIVGAVTSAPSQLLYLESRFAGGALTLLPPGTKSCN
ncbi:lipase family protein [Solimonas sp. K1W22B-7]|uniref:lipase family protein n=1 Tax=Solimonas sp. K1W22B-7 TaxID=2303331 RepID=UPI0013C462A5|nr:lipase family protein [Solimonas sp. K1W22B-7]